MVRFKIKKNVPFNVDHTKAFALLAPYYKLIPDNLYPVQVEIIPKKFEEDRSFFDNKTNKITLKFAQNQSQDEMDWVLLHEFAHFMENNNQQLKLATEVYENMSLHLLFQKVFKLPESKVREIFHDFFPAEVFANSFATILLGKYYKRHPFALADKQLRRIGINIMSAMEEMKKMGEAEMSGKSIDDEQEIKEEFVRDRIHKIISEEFADVARIADKGKGEWVDLSEPAVEPAAKKDFPTRKNLFDLVDFTYRNVLHEPNVSVKSPSDVLAPPYEYWEAINIDNAPDADAVLFGKEKNGIKIAGIGHDGEPMSKSHLVKHIIETLKQPGYWIEASGPLGKVLWQAGVPTIADPQKLQKLFPDSKFENMTKDGAYIRTLGAGKKTEVERVFGSPKI